MRGYLQATIEEFRKALASHNTGLHARARVDEARRFMGETACKREYSHPLHKHGIADTVWVGYRDGYGNILSVLWRLHELG